MYLVVLTLLLLGMFLPTSSLFEKKIPSFLYSESLDEDILECFDITECLDCLEATEGRRIPRGFCPATLPIDLIMNVTSSNSYNMVFD